jgi:anti-anti-sigma factor
MDGHLVPFTVDVCMAGPTFVLLVHGELDMATAPQLAAALLGAMESGDADVVIDLSGVSFIDSSGIATIVRSHHALQSARRGLTLRNPTNTVRRTFAISGLSGYLTLVGPADG